MRKAGLAPAEPSPVSPGVTRSASSSAWKRTAACTARYACAFGTSLCPLFSNSLTPSVFCSSVIAFDTAGWLTPA